MSFLRSLLFSLGMLLNTVVISAAALLCSPLPFHKRYAVVRYFSVWTLAWLKWTCKIDYRVQGLEHIPPGSALIFCKHQSTFETMALQLIFPPQTFVIKRELLWVPIFGWGLATLKPIAIRRGSGRQAIKQVVAQGIERLKQGIWVVIFPEGTRVKAGSKGRYKIGGAVLAAESGYPVVPVAHNAGEFWPRGGFLKRPGTVHVVIGPAIETKGKPADQILAEAEAYIEDQMSKISHA